MLKQTQTCVSCLLLAACILISASTFAQDLRQGLVLDEFDPRALSVNPALLSFQAPTLFSSYQRLHLGFTDASSRFQTIQFGLSLPFFIGNLGFATYYSGFQSSIFSRNHLSTILGYRLFRKIGLGVTATMRQIGYNLENAILIDEDDPVFRSGTSRITFSVDAGFSVSISPRLFITGGIRNLNEPPLSLQEYRFKDKMSYFAGMAIRVGFVRLLFDASWDKEQLYHKLAFEVSNSFGRYLRLGYSPNRLIPNIDLQIPLAGGLKFRYAYHLPLTGSSDNPLQGSHLFTILFDLRRFKGLPPEPDYPVPDPIFDVRDRLSNTGGAMLAVPSETRVDLNEKEIIREFDATITPSILAHLSPAYIGESDSRWTLKPAVLKLDTTALVPRLISPMGRTTSPEYEKTFQLLSQKVRKDSTLNLYLIAARQDLYRAAQVRNRYLDGRGSIPPNVRLATPVFNSVEDSLRFFARLGNRPIRLKEHHIDTEPDTLGFTIHDGRFQTSHSAWRLLIFGPQYELIRSLEGFKGQQTIYWDLRDESGKLVGPGVYSFRLQWKDHRGESRGSPLQKLYFRKRKRTLHVTITRDPRVIEKTQAKQVNVFFRK